MEHMEEIKDKKDEDHSISPKKIQKYCQIDNILLPGKLSYFFGTGSKYTLMAFMVLFLTRVGLNPQEAGYVIGTRYTVEVVGSIFSNFVADRWERHRLVVLVCILLSTVVTFPIPWLAEEVNKESQGSSGTTKSSKLKFIVLLLSNAFAACFDGGIRPAIDARVFEISKEVSKTAYIKQRIWVSIGIGVAPFIAGILIEKNYDGGKVLFFFVLALNVCLAVSCFCLFTQKKKARREEELECETVGRKSKRSQCEDLMSTLQNPDVLITLVCFLFIGLGFMFQYSFVFLLLQTEVNASRITMGFLALLQAFAEVLAAPIGHKLEVYFKSSFVPIMFSFVGFAVSFLLYYYVENIVFMACTSILVGASYSIFMYPAANLLFRFSTENCRGTVFAISSALLNGTGGCIAGFLGGYLFRTYGGRKSFKTISGVYFGLSFILAVFSLTRMTYRIYKRKSKMTSNVIR